MTAIVLTANAQKNLIADVSQKKVANAPLMEAAATKNALLSLAANAAKIALAAMVTANADPKEEIDNQSLTSSKKSYS